MNCADGRCEHKLDRVLALSRNVKQIADTSDQSFKGTDGDVEIELPCVVDDMGHRILDLYKVSSDCDNLSLTNAKILLH